MKKLLKSALSLALVLVLVLSLGVAAFADDSAKDNKDEDKEPKTIQIYFNLGTMEPCSVLMRNLDYDDIRLNGISYRADAKDGVIAIELADLAAAKLLTEYKDEAEKAGIDFDKIYIRRGKVLVKDDAGLSSTEISNLKSAISSFMSSKRIGVNIGDKFELSNGTELKFYVQVFNFIYPQQAAKENIKIKALNDKDLEHPENFLNMDGGDVKSAKTPAITTLYFYYDVTDSYTNNDDAIAARETNPDSAPSGQPSLKKTTNGAGAVGIAKSKDDSNTYYIQINFEGDTSSEFNQMTDLTTTEGPDDTGEGENAKKGFWNSLFDLFKRDGNGNIEKLANNVKISTDKEGKNVVRDIDIKDKTPDLDTIKEEAKKEGGTYSQETITEGEGEGEGEAEAEIGTINHPDTTTKLTKDDGTKAEIEVKNRATDMCADGHEWGDGEPTGVENEIKLTCKRCGVTRIDTVEKPNPASLLGANPYPMSPVDINDSNDSSDNLNGGNNGNNGNNENTGNDDNT